MSFEAVLESGEMQLPSSLSEENLCFWKEETWILRDGCLFRPQTCGEHNFASADHLWKQRISSDRTMDSKY